MYFCIILFSYFFNLIFFCWDVLFLNEYTESCNSNFNSLKYVRYVVGATDPNPNPNPTPKLNPDLNTILDLNPNPHSLKYLTSGGTDTKLNLDLNTILDLKPNPNPQPNLALKSILIYPDSDFVNINPNPKGVVVTKYDYKIFCELQELSDERYYLQKALSKQNDAVLISSIESRIKDIEFRDNFLSRYIKISDFDKLSKPYLLPPILPPDPDIYLKNLKASGSNLYLLEILQNHDKFLKDSVIQDSKTMFNHDKFLKDSVIQDPKTMFNLDKFYFENPVDKSSFEKPLDLYCKLKGLLISNWYLSEAVKKGDYNEEYGAEIMNKMIDFQGKINVLEKKITRAEEYAFDKQLDGLNSELRTSKNTKEYMVKFLNELYPDKTSNVSSSSAVNNNNNLKNSEGSLSLDQLFKNSKGSLTIDQLFKDSKTTLNLDKTSNVSSSSAVNNNNSLKNLETVSNLDKDFNDIDLEMLSNLDQHLKSLEIASNLDKDLKNSDLEILSKFVQHFKDLEAASDLDEELNEMELNDKALDIFLNYDKRLKDPEILSHSNKNLKTALNLDKISDMNDKPSYVKDFPVKKAGPVSNKPIPLNITITEEQQSVISIITGVTFFVMFIIVIL